MSEPIRSGPIAWMARNTVVANLLMFFLLAAGIFIGRGVKQEVFPEVTLDLITVAVAYPGASPEEAEAAICLRLEEAVRGVDGIKRISCSAGDSSAMGWFSLQADADADKVLQEVKSAIDRIRTFPVDVERPIVSLPATQAEVISMVIYGDLDERTLRQTAVGIRDEMLALDEVSSVSLSGVRSYETVVEVRREDLRRYKLSMPDLARLIRAASIDLPAGSLRTAAGEILIRTTEQRFTALEYSELTILSKPDGTSVKLGDIATVRDTFSETFVEASFNGQPAVMLTVSRVGKQTPKGVATAVKKFTERMSDELPPAVHVATWMDRSEMLAGRMALLTRNAATGLLLVILILALFLEIRLAFWVTLGIPISFAGAFLLLPVMGASVNMISLFGFILVLGLVVDDAIVVGENIYARRQAGQDIERAAIEGAREVGHPVIFSILTTVAAFSPLAFVGGMMGKFMWAVPVVVVSVLFFSLVESLLILPAHLNHEPKDVRWVRPFHAVQGAVDRVLQRFLQGPFRRAVARAVAYRYSTIAFLTLLVLITAGMIKGGYLEFRFFPPIESDRVNANITLTVGVPEEETRAVMAKVVAEAQKLIAQLDKEQGHATSRGIYALLGSRQSRGGPGNFGLGSSGVSHKASVRINFAEEDIRGFSTLDFEKDWRKAVGKVPGVVNIAFRSNFGPGFGAPIMVQFSHRDSKQLEAAADALRSELERIDGVTDVEDGRSSGKPQLDLKLTAAGRSAGLSESSLARQVRAAFYGAEALRQQRDRDELRVMVKLPKSQRGHLSDLDALLIRTPRGGEMPLRQAAKISEGLAYTSIQRKEGKRVLAVEARVNASVVNAGQVNADLKKTILPKIISEFPGLTYTFEGEHKERQESFRALGKAALLALLVIYILLAIPFKSYIQPLAVMSAIPFGLVGAAWGHFLLGMPLTFISMMGILALAGVVVNDSLVLVDFINRYRRDEDDLELAVTEAAIRRFRPIFLTSMTTFFGLLPMLLETSIQAKFLVPMAVSLAFGVLFATVVILFLVPSIYLVLEDISALFRTKKPLPKTQQAMPVAD
ncbi:MAG: efflux RND transporter permease subunit [Myxococcota bacterium]|nr:efflux RND transporter permease subunit [Myxococcota bacterium]